MYQVFMYVLGIVKQWKPVRHLQWRGLHCQKQSTSHVLIIMLFVVRGSLAVAVDSHHKALAKRLCTLHEVSPVKRHSISSSAIVHTSD